MTVYASTYFFAAAFSAAFFFSAAAQAQVPPGENTLRHELQPQEEAAELRQDNKMLSADLVLEWQTEYRSHSDDESIDDTTHSFARAELAPTLRLSPSWFIDGVFVFEPFDQAAEVNAGNDIWFDREGAFVEELKLNFVHGPYAAWAGKFNPAFGRAWDYGRGIWSEDFAEDYEITEKLGLGASYTFEAAGTHTVSGTTFFADTSLLSDSIITARDQVRLSDGGASNTEDLSSFTLSFDGENAADIENLGYHIAIRSLAEQDKGADETTGRETGYVVSINYAAPLNDRTGIDMLVEYAGINNFEGIENADRRYLSGSVITTFDERWNITLGGTYRQIDEPGLDSDESFAAADGRA